VRVPPPHWYNENWVKSHKGMMSPLTQNLEALGLQVFFLICCSTLSFLPSVRLRLTLKYLTLPSTQNLKTLSLQVFFFICRSTFSFLHNVRLRLTLKYLTIIIRVPSPPPLSQNWEDETTDNRTKATRNRKFSYAVDDNKMNSKD